MGPWFQNSLVVIAFLTMTLYSKHILSLVRNVPDPKAISQAMSRRLLSTTVSSESDVQSASYTKGVLSNFIKYATTDQRQGSPPPLDVTELVRILQASIEQHKVMANVLRLKVPSLEKSAFVSAATELDGSTRVESSPEYGTFTICGDTHGQFLDVMNIFSDRIGGYPSNSNVFLFNGDYVDRGAHSIEVIIALLLIKLFS